MNWCLFQQFDLNLLDVSASDHQIFVRKRPTNSNQTSKYVSWSASQYHIVCGVKGMTDILVFKSSSFYSAVKYTQLRKLLEPH